MEIPVDPQQAVVMPALHVCEFPAGMAPGKGAVLLVDIVDPQDIVDAVHLVLQGHVEPDVGEDNMLVHLLVEGIRAHQIGSDDVEFLSPESCT